MYTHSTHFTSCLSDCKQNKPLWTTIKLKDSIDLEEMLNVSEVSICLLAFEPNNIQLCEMHPGTFCSHRCCKVKDLFLWGRGGQIFGSVLINHMHCCATKRKKYLKSTRDFFKIWNYEKNWIICVFSSLGPTVHKTCTDAVWQYTHHSIRIHYPEPWSTKPAQRILSKGQRF